MGAAADLATRGYSGACLPEEKMLRIKANVKDSNDTFCQVYNPLILDSFLAYCAAFGSSTPASRSTSAVSCPSFGGARRVEAGDAA